MNETWDPSKEVKGRIELARSNVFFKFKDVFTNRDFNTAFLRLCFDNRHIFSVWLYGMEIWTFKVTDINMREAFEMWTAENPLDCLVTNTEVLQKIN